MCIRDSGNADHALNEDGTPNTAHSLNPVPCVYVTENKAAKVEDGRLADVAPTDVYKRQSILCYKNIFAYKFA